jgi:hypothetical protein
VKRIAVGLVLVVMLNLVPQASAQDASAGLRTGQLAVATWMIYRDGKPHRYYVAVIDRSVGRTPNVVDTYVLAARGSCLKRRFFTVCSAGGPMHQASLDEATFDPMQESATMRFKARGYTHSATWTAVEDPEPAHYLERYNEPGYTEVYAGVDSYRSAKTTGRLFGRRMPRMRASDFGFLWQGTWGYAYSIGGPADVEISPDGFVTVTTKIR